MNIFQNEIKETKLDIFKFEMLPFSKCCPTATLAFKNKHQA